MRNLLKFFFGALCYSILAVGKDGSPMGVVWQGGAYMGCSSEHIRMKLKLGIVSHSQH